MVILGMEFTVSVKSAAQYQTRGTDSVHHISGHEEESWTYSIMQSRVFLTKSTVLGIVMKLYFTFL